MKRKAAYRFSPGRYAAFLLRLKFAYYICKKERTKEGVKNDERIHF